MTPEPFARRELRPTWTAERVRRTLTDEPGKGMGAPFSEADAQAFLRTYGLLPNKAGPPADAELLERMWRWLEEHLD